MLKKLDWGSNLDIISGSSFTSWWNASPRQTHPRFYPWEFTVYESS